MFDSPRPGGSRSTDIVVGVLPGPYDGRIADPPGNLPREAARGRDRRDVAGRVHHIEVDGPGRSHHHRFGIGHLEPVVIRSSVRPPDEPLLPRLRSEQVFLLEAIGECELLRAFTHQQDVIGVFQHQARHLARRLDTLQRANCPCPSGRPVHAGAIELHDTVGVWQAAITHRIILGIEFLDLHPLHRRVQRIGPLKHEFNGAGYRRKAVRRADGDGLGRRRTTNEGRLDRVRPSTRGSAITAARDPAEPRNARRLGRSVTRVILDGEGNAAGDHGI